MILRPHLLTCLCALALVAFVAPAQAQDPQVDPGSPAGTEYQLPIDRAREEAGRGSGGPVASPGGSATSEAPLFGAGVEGRKSGSGAGKQKSGDSDSDPRTQKGVEPNRGRTPETVRSGASAPASGGSVLVAIGGGAAGVLLLGGIAGLALRRSSTRGA
jgi:hypothetical protein